MKNYLLKITSLIFILPAWMSYARAQSKPGLTINSQEYFETPGINVMVYHDYYPMGHQSGITIIQNGSRVAANGDIRVEFFPRPYAEHGKRVVDFDRNEISIKVGYPDSMKNEQQDPRYALPKINLSTLVKVKGEGNMIHISVDLDHPLPSNWEGKIFFQMELFPANYFGKTFYMDATPGLFPRQANGPVIKTADGEIEAEPMARGNKLVVCPESEYDMLTFESNEEKLELLDGRNDSKNGWFIVRSPLKSGTTSGAIDWNITIACRPDYKYDPVVQVSELGYTTNQSKMAVIEMDKLDNNIQDVSILRISEKGGYETVKTGKPEVWGNFLRYKYARFDFTDVRQPGMYKIRYGHSVSDPFMIDDQVYKQNAWQPTLEYFLPVQMCHMRINDGSKVWHGLCHDDDALMAPVNHIHFDGYRQGPSTLTRFKDYDPVPGLNVGGWHDAGDYDLRVESQAGTARVLSFAWELFKPMIDETTVDQKNKIVEMHVPDGIPDILQQIEHGALTVVAGYKSLGRLYRGIIEPTGRQYTLLGDGDNITDNLFYDASLKPGQKELGHSNVKDDRLVFTEENPRREVQVAADLGTAYRCLKGYNDSLANDCLGIAKALFDKNMSSDMPGLIDAAAELYLSTGDQQYMKFILAHKDLVVSQIERTGPAIARIITKINDKKFIKDVHTALEGYARKVQDIANETPYGVSYKPDVWGYGWNIQEFGVNLYFLHRAFPDIFPADPVYHALNFILGVHPGENTSSFVSGVGVRSLLIAYGFNRDDWTYIPGGSASGTAIIRPDLPELKVWPYFWQQTEYVMGGGATNYMFMILAADDMLNQK